MVVSRRFSKLHCLDDEGGESEFGKPFRMRLVMHLLRLRVTANVQDSRALGVGRWGLGQVEVGGDVEVWKAFVVELLDSMGWAVYRAGDFIRNRRAVFSRRK